jgi:hypothetical protein
MQKSKLMFSDAELQMALDKEVILTKNRIIERVYDEFGHLGRKIYDEMKPFQSIFPDELCILPKISKGENYNGMPWVMLDYPRFFNKENGHFAIRVFFCWGNGFLVQLHVSKKFAIPVLSKGKNHLIPQSIAGFPVWVGFPSDPWAFQLPQEGMFPLADFDWNYLLPQDQVFKCAISLPVQQSPALYEAMSNFASFIS